MDDFIAGLVAGNVALVVGHPMDTIKSLIQTRNHKSILKTIQFLSNEKKVIIKFKQKKRQNFI